jgi:hypothetical protein
MVLCFVSVTWLRHATGTFTSHMIQCWKSCIVFQGNCLDSNYHQKQPYTQEISSLDILEDFQKTYWRVKNFL